jgi:hypothetical protein
MSNNEYHRPPGAAARDFAEARVWEEQVADMFPADQIVTQFDSPDALDIWFPGFYLELKEKKQKYGQRWWLIDNVPEQSLFIIDELTVRRGAEKYPAVFFLLRDRPRGRLYYAPIWELLAVERVRLNRKTKGALKGKWVFDIENFRRIDSVEEARVMAVQDLASQAWRQSHCLSEKDVPNP